MNDKTSAFNIRLKEKLFIYDIVKTIFHFIVNIFPVAYTPPPTPFFLKSNSFTLSNDVRYK